MAIETTSGPDRGRFASGTRWFGLMLHGGIAIFPLASSGLLAPPWALALVGVTWLAAAVLAWRVSRARPLLTPLIPIATLAAWFAFMAFGDGVLGWTG